MLICGMYIFCGYYKQSDSLESSISIHNVCVFVHVHVQCGYIRERGNIEI